MPSSTNKNNTNSMTQTNKHVNPKLNVFTNANKIKQKALLSNSTPISDWTTQKKKNHSKFSNSNSEPSTFPQVRPLKNKNKLFITKNRYEVLSQMEKPSKLPMEEVHARILNQKLSLNPLILYLLKMYTISQICPQS